MRNLELASQGREGMHATWTMAACLFGTGYGRNGKRALVVRDKERGGFCLLGRMRACVYVCARLSSGRLALVAGTGGGAFANEEQTFFFFSDWSRGYKVAR